MLIFMKGEEKMIHKVPLKLEGVYVLEYDLCQDNRGTSHKIISNHLLETVGIQTVFTEATIYCPKYKGTLYGIHYQNHPASQAKLQYCIKGRGLDFAVDLRKASPTYKQWVCVELTPENRKQIYIPHGFGHAFISLEDDTEVIMHIDRPFSEESRTIAWNDPELNIEFPVKQPILSQRDVEAPLLRESDCNL